MSFETKTTNEITNDMIINVINSVDSITDLNPGSVFRTLVESLSQELSDLYTQLQSIYNGTRINTATSDDLDNLGAIVGVDRNTGNVAEGTITFIRETVSGSDFTIPSRTIVSTQPNTADNPLRFITLSSTTFDSDITGESSLFIDGIYNYSLSQRLIGSISSLSATVSSSSQVLLEDTDFQITNNFDGVIPDTTTYELTDNCDATSGWTGSTDASTIAVNTGDKKQGTGSLYLGKTGTTENFVYYRKTLSSSIDMEGKRQFLFLKALNQTAINKIPSVKIRISSDSTPDNNYYEFAADTLTTGWVLQDFDPTQATGITIVGSPNVTNINSIQIRVNTNNISDTLTSGDVRMDFWFVAEATDYRGDVVEFIDGGTSPDTNTSFIVNWKPLSVDATINSEEVGSTYNVGQDTIVYKVSDVANISRVNNYVSLSVGQDIETDTAYRARIKNASSSAGKATVEALRQAILGVQGVVSVSVSDLPEKAATDEAIVYHTAVKENKLANEIAFVDDELTPTNIVVSNTAGGSADYTYGTDYTLEDGTSYILWTASGGTYPSDGATVYANYAYNWLGHVEISVAGVSTPITTEVQALIDTAISETKAAGVSVTWTETTVQYINIEMTLSVDTVNGYSETTVKEEVKANIINWLNNMQIGEDVLLSEFYQVVMNTDGVTNVTITDWDGDVSAPFPDISIGANEVARPEDGGIIVN